MPLTSQAERAQRAMASFANEQRTADFVTLFVYARTVSEFRATCSANAMLKVLFARFPERRSETDALVVRNFARHFEKYLSSRGHQADDAVFDGQAREVLDDYMAWEGMDRARYYAVVREVPNQQGDYLNPYRAAVNLTKSIIGSPQRFSPAQISEARRQLKMYTDRWAKMGSVPPA